jgi:hypothetical protein
MRNLTVVIAVLSVLSAATVAAAGEVVVVRSTASGLKPGQVLDASKPLALAHGSAVTVIAEDGRAISLSGPFYGVPVGEQGSAPGGSALIRSLSRLMTGKTPETHELGMMRGEKGAGSPDAWSIDVIRSGAHCVPAGAEAVLWRPNGVTAETVTIRRLPWGEKVTSDWPAGTNIMGWPKALPLEDGAEYLIRLSSRISGAKLAVFLVPANLPTDAHRAAWMGDHGCVAQALVLIAEMR